jgi:hypothetical protein
MEIVYTQYNVLARTYNDTAQLLYVAATDLCNDIVWQNRPLTGIIAQINEVLVFT